jgi:tetratricopeptide (TPR) repeat protein
VLAFLWRAAWVTGRCRRWITGGWRRPALWIVATALVLWLVDRWIVSLSWLSLWSALVLAVVAAFAHAVWQARVRMVVEPFLDYTTVQPEQEEDAPRAEAATEAPGVNAILVSELAALRDLFRTVTRPRSGVQTAVGKGQPLQATLQLEDVGEFLRSASVGDSKLSIGPFTVPIGTVMAMLGRLAQGPRVSGALQVVRSTGPDGDTLRAATLTAYYAGRDGLASWSVERELADETTPLVHTAAMRAMIEELAARMFADLALSGTSSWRASKRFLEALELYRLAQESKSDRTLKLKHAERAFVEALGHDEDIPLARYNLGVIYRELNRDAREEDAGHLEKAAEMAFRDELQRPGADWQPYYALAQTYYDARRFSDVAPLCDRVLELAREPQHKAEAYDLKGLAERQLPDIEAPRALARATLSRRRAVAYAWLALLRAEVAAGDPLPARGVAAHCLINLGVAVAYRVFAQAPGRSRRRTYRQCKSLMRRCVRVEDRYLPQFELGKIAQDYEDRQLAVSQLKAALRIDPTAAPCWTRLAEVDAQLHAEAVAEGAFLRANEWAVLARHATARARDYLEVRVLTASELDDIVERLAGALDEIGDVVEAAAVRRMPETLDRLAASTLADVDDLRGLRDDEGDAWLRGQISVRMGDLYREDEQHVLAEECYAAAIEAFDDSYPDEIRRRGLKGMLAGSLQSQDGKQQHALREAHAAVAAAPTSWWERDVLGNVYTNVGDLESAVESYEAALLWEPNNPWLHRKLGNCHWNIGDDSMRRERRAQAFRKAIEHYQAVLDLHSPSDFRSRVSAHYWLGRVHTEAGDYDHAIPHFRNACAERGPAPVVQLYLGQAYVRMKGYAKAEDTLTQAIAAADQIAAPDPTKTIGAEVEDEWPAAALGAMARCLLALSLIERDARFDEARTHILDARALLDRLAEPGYEAIRASSYELEGRILLEEEKVDLALAAFREAVGLSPDPETYAHLARALAAKAETVRTKRERRWWLDRAWRACRHARDLDTTGEYGTGIDETAAALRIGLDAVAGPLPAAQQDGHKPAPATTLG